jgi:hypothetical protein
MKKVLQAFPISKSVMLLFALLISANLMAQSFLKAHPHINPYQYVVVKEKSFDNGAVTSAHPLARFSIQQALPSIVSFLQNLERS